MLRTLGKKLVGPHYPWTRGDLLTFCFQASRLVLLFGAYALVDGIFNVIALFRVASRQLALLVEGVIGIIAGSLTFAWPAITVIVPLHMFASWAMVTGVFEIVGGIRLRKAVAKEWLLLVLCVLFGVRTPSLRSSSLAIHSLAPGRIVVGRSRESIRAGSLAVAVAMSTFRAAVERLHPFLKQSELFAKEQVLGDDGGAGGSEKTDQQEKATFSRSLRDHLRLFSLLVNAANNQSVLSFAHVYCSSPQSGTSSTPPRR